MQMARGGVSNPPGRPRDGSGRKTGGLLTPPLLCAEPPHGHSRPAKNAVRTRVMRHSLSPQVAADATLVATRRREVVITAVRPVAFRASRYRHDNHRALSRLPSRRQPFRTRRCRPGVRDASTDVREHGNPPVRCGVREPRQGGAIPEDRGGHHRARSTVCRAPDSVALRT